MSQRLTSTQRDFITSNHGLAETIAHDFLARAPGLDIEEIVAVAYQGLVTAALRYDASTGVPFGPWASKMIKFEVLMWQRKEDYLDRGLRADFKKLTAAGLKTEEAPSIAILATRTGLTVKRISTVIRAEQSKPFSASSTAFNPAPGDSVQQFGGYDTMETDSSPDDVESSVMVGALQGSVVSVVRNLPALQRVILAMRYMEGHEMKAIAEMLETPLSVIRAAHSEAVLAVHEETIRQARHHD